MLRKKEAIQMPWKAFLKVINCDSSSQFRKRDSTSSNTFLPENKKQNKNLDDLSRTFVVRKSKIGHPSIYSKADYLTTTCIRVDICERERVRTCMTAELVLEACQGRNESFAMNCMLAPRALAILHVLSRSVQPFCDVSIATANGQNKSDVPFSFMNPPIRPYTGLFVSFTRRTLYVIHSLAREFRVSSFEFRVPSALLDIQESRQRNALIRNAGRKQLTSSYKKFVHYHSR